MKVYMDYAATTPTDPRVVRAMQPFFSRKFANTMSLHSMGREARQGLEDSRDTIEKFINAGENEVIFTGSATEADNLAIKGVAFANRDKGRHIITSAIEHHAVLDTCKWLEKQGFDVTYLHVDRYGLVDPDRLMRSIRSDTILVSIMHANNEIGTIEPISELGKICKDRGVPFHTDAVQTFGKIPIDVKKMNIDMLSASAHKFYGPKGVGALYVRNGIKMEPLFQGGGHEKGLRSSTVNVPGIVGMAEAVRLRQKEMNAEAKKLTALRDALIKNALKIEGSHLNGHPTSRLPNNANFWFSYIEGESLVVQLDMEGIEASTGSACSSESLEPSHVLMAIGLKHEEAHGSLRLSLGSKNTKAEVNYVSRKLPKVVENLRKVSPFKGRC